MVDLMISLLSQKIAAEPRGEPFKLAKFTSVPAKVNTNREGCKLLNNSAAVMLNFVCVYSC